MRDQIQAWRESGREVLSAESLAARSPALSSVNDENRTVDCLWYTGASVSRYDWWTDTSYTLEFDPEGADLSQLNSGAPVLDMHSVYDGAAGQIGRVERAWAEKGKFYGTLRFAKTPDVDNLWTKVQSGIVTKFSMGVELLEVNEKRDKDGKLLTKTATKWRPFEISTCSLPADFGTQTLSAASVKQPPETSKTEPEKPASEIGASAQQETQMEQQEQTGAADKPVVNQPPAPGAGAPQPAAATEEQLAQARKGERERVSAIQKRAKLGGIAEEFARTLIDDGVTLEQASERIFAEMAKNGGDQIETRPHAKVTRDADVTRRAAMTAALLNRYDAKAYEFKDVSQEFAFMSLIDMAKECLAAKGVQTRGMSKTRIAELALTTSDLPNISADAANRTLRDAYMAAPRTFLPFSRKRTAADFRTINSIGLGEAPALEKINEHGEYHYGKLSDAAEKYALATYGKIIALTRKVIINDDLGALTRLPASYGVSAANLENDIVWGIITGNPVMSDGIHLFDPAHGNYVASTSGPPNVADVAALRLLASQAKGMDGVTLINVALKYLVVPGALLTNAEQLVTPILPALLTSVVPSYYRGLTIISDPRLDANSPTAWYMFADPASIDTIEYAYLEGQEGVYLETKAGWDIDGIEYKARLDFGAAAIDWRGMYKTAGVP